MLSSITPWLIGLTLYFGLVFCVLAVVCGGTRKPTPKD